MNDTVYIIIIMSLVLWVSAPVILNSYSTMFDNRLSKAAKIWLLIGAPVTIPAVLLIGMVYITAESLKELFNE